MRCVERTFQESGLCFIPQGGWYCLVVEVWDGFIGLRGGACYFSGNLKRCLLNGGLGLCWEVVYFSSLILEFANYACEHSRLFARQSNISIY